MSPEAMLFEGPIRVLVTGANGFVGRHLVETLADHLPLENILACTHGLPNLPRVESQTLDIRDRSALDATLARWKPTHIVHLAAIAAVPIADRDPRATWNINLHGSLNIAGSILSVSPDTFLLFVSSSEIYGGSFKGGQPIDESGLLQPLNTYASTKAAADLALGQMVNQGLKLARARPFNHTGPWQSPAFAIPAFATQIARIEMGLQPAVMEVGNLDAERDLLDVRDVVDAYLRILARSGMLENGSIFNIASGTPRKMQGVVDDLRSLSSIQITLRTDPARLRRADIARAIGNAAKATQLLDWWPRIAWRETLKSVLDYCRNTVGA